MAEAPASPWLLLIHQLPPKPPYLRVKVWRRLQSMGAVPIKNSVYVLPNTDEAREDFEWILKEIRTQGGDASICEARLVDGLTDDEVHRLFTDAREADYRELSAAIRAFGQATLPARARTLSDDVRAQVDAGVARFRKRLAEIAKIDFFAAPGRVAVEGLVGSLEQRAAPARPARTAAPRHMAIADVRRRTWVTRKGIHIDRIACAWLVRRFIDPEASFKFVPPRGYEATPRELRFDMFDAEFTHDGDLCSFEVMLRDFGLQDPALHAVAEVVHAVDLKEAKYYREETRGIDHLVAGLAWAEAGDEERLARGVAIFDALYSWYGRRKNARRDG